MFYIGITCKIKFMVTLPYVSACMSSKVFSELYNIAYILIEKSS